MRESNQFDLLKQRRFAPFFWTQFCGAGNDNATLEHFSPPAKGVSLCREGVNEARSRQVLFWDQTNSV